ncbi:MAG: type III-B CRISPR module-associated protein Cmr5, partial [bacterium]
MNQDTTQTLDQRRAAFAREKIRHLETSGRDYGHYVSYASALPATIVMNGLGQALATQLAKAKGKQEHPRRLLYDHVADWLSRQMEELHVPEKELPRVVDLLMEHNQSVYVRAQAEAMAYLNWLKQFARA